MGIFDQVVIVIGIIAVAYGAFAAGLTIRAILKRRDKDYQALYAEFLEQKQRVRKRMRRSEKDG